MPPAWGIDLDISEVSRFRAFLFPFLCVVVYSPPTFLFNLSHAPGMALGEGGGLTFVFLRHAPGMAVRVGP